MTTTLAIIKNYLQCYYDEVFQKEYFISILAMMAVIISVNYSWSWPSPQNWWLSFLTDYGLYLLPFTIAYALQWFYFRSDRTGFSNAWFWVLLFIAPALFAFRVNFNFHHALLASFTTAQNERFVSSIINYTVKVLVLMLPILFIWFLKDRRHFPLYGFSKHRHRKMYVMLLAAMLPLIAAAALLPDFLHTYPKAMTNAGLHSTDSFARFIGFELAYGFDFFSIEFFFRGFLIIAFIKYFGMRAIVPAACFYCCIHLGKPMPEAVSSFFGGLLLGIISYHTKSIWGGLFVHVGIAWLMEIAALVIHHF